MARPRTELALRPKSPAADAPAEPILYTHAPAQTQYVIQQTLLGDFAMHWTADWLAGLFCVEDFPPQWVAYVQNTLLGSRYEGSWQGEDRPFAESLTEVMRAGGPFAGVAQALLHEHHSSQHRELPPTQH